MTKIAIIFGTRPEAIKLCPLILALRKSKRVEVEVCVTGQHRDMLDQVLALFGIKPDVDLHSMTPRQSLGKLTSRIVAGLDKYLDNSRPDLVIVQGDTTTAICGALSAFYRRIPVAHIEAGLRTGNKFSPFPEEINRVFVSRLADLHFAPTAEARANLIREGISRSAVFVTGNTGIDALQFVARGVRKAGLSAALKNVIPAAVHRRLFHISGDRQRKLVLITSHRRENFGKGFERICCAIASLADRFPDVEFIYPVHLNPNVQKPVFSLLAGKSNVCLTRPLAYREFVALMDRAWLILTDSGGIQEEAPSLGKPVLVMRDTTERPEGVKAGTVKLVGTDGAAILREVAALLLDSKAYSRMARAHNPYGDGHACARIVRRLLRAGNS